MGAADCVWVIMCASVVGYMFVSCNGTTGVGEGEVENVMGDGAGRTVPRSGRKRSGCVMLGLDEAAGREIGDGGVETVEGVVEVGGGARAGVVARGGRDHPEGEDIQH